MTNWRIKSAIFRGMERLPPSLADAAKTTIHRLRKSYARRPAHFARFDQVASELIAHGVGPERARYYEFGAGADLAFNIYLYCCGFNDQTVIDWRPEIKPDLIAQVIQGMSEDGLPSRANRQPAAGARLHDLGIVYQAPADASNVQVPAETFDAIATINTLEHIPLDDLARITSECRRIIKPTGVMVHLIDPSDHYSHGDKSIDAYNFLQFSADEWKRHNTSRLYQSRARHSQYRKLFQQCGFEIVKEDVEREEDWQAKLASIPIHAEFKEYAAEDLAVKTSCFVLRPS